MKKTFIIIFIVLGCNLAGIFYLLHPTINSDEIINVAACLPMGTVKGQMMLNGINLYLSELARENSKLHKRIKLQVYDDKDDPGTAAYLANQIGIDNTTAVVLGHNDNTAGIRAGKVYKRFGIIAITGSATATDVTMANEWSFSVVPNDEYQVAVLAAFIRSRGGQVSIIQNESYENTSLIRIFERIASQSNITITRKWQFRSTKGLDKIVREIDRQESTPGFILLNISREDAVKVFTGLSHRKDLNFISPTAIADSLMIEAPDSLAIKNTFPKGHFFDGLYTVFPFFIETSDNRANGFRSRYRQRFDHDPSWESACYYDAMKLLAHALQNTPFNPDDNIVKKRTQLRKTLERYNSRDESVNGITGNLYFNQDGCVERPYIIGQYVNGLFRPFFMQYHKEEGSHEQALEKVLRGEAVWVNNILMDKKQVVYCGMKVNAIENIDFDNEWFTADFYLWFRFLGDFNEADIFFPDAVTSVSLDKPVWEQTQDNIKTRVYRIKRTFTNNFNFFAFPFERHRLNIHFHQHSMKKNNLIYLKDDVGLPGAVDKEAGGPSLDSDSNWRVVSVNSFNAIVTHISTLGVPDNALHPAVINYPSFDTNILIAPQNLFFPHLHLLPFILALVLSGFAVYGSAHNRNTGFMLLAASLTIALMNHAWLAGRVWINYLMFIEYLLFGFYALVIVIGVVQIKRYTLLQRDQVKQAIILSRLFKVVYPLVIFLGVGWMIYYIRTLG